MPEATQCAMCKAVFEKPTHGCDPSAFRAAMKWVSERSVWFCDKTHTTPYFEWVDAIREMTATATDKKEVGECKRCKAPVYDAYCFETWLADGEPVRFCDPYCMSRFEITDRDFMEQIYTAQRAKFDKHLRDNGIDPDLLQGGDEETVNKVMTLMQDVMKKLDHENQEAGVAVVNAE